MEQQGHCVNMQRHLLRLTLHALEGQLNHHLALLPLLQPPRPQICRAPVQPHQAPGGDAACTGQHQVRAHDGRARTGAVLALALAQQVGYPYSACWLANRFLCELPKMAHACRCYC